MKNKNSGHENIYLHIKKLTLYKILLGIPFVYLTICLAVFCYGVEEYLNQLPIWIFIGVLIIFIMLLMGISLGTVALITSNEKDWGIKK